MDATNSVMIGFSLAASLLDSMGEKEEFVACVCDGGAARADEPLFKWSEKKMGDPREPRRVAERERAREGECILSL